MENALLADQSLSESSPCDPWVVSVGKSCFAGEHCLLLASRQASTPSTHTFCACLSAFAQFPGAASVHTSPEPGMAEMCVLTVLWVLSPSEEKKATGSSCLSKPELSYVWFPHGEIRKFHQESGQGNGRHLGILNTEKSREWETKRRHENHGAMQDDSPRTWGLGSRGALAAWPPDPTGLSVWDCVAASFSSKLESLEFSASARIPHWRRKWKRNEDQFDFCSAELPIHHWGWHWDFTRTGNCHIAMGITVSSVTC